MLSLMKGSPTERRAFVHELKALALSFKKQTLVEELEGHERSLPPS
jgi:hypothetical protein